MLQSLQPDTEALKLSRKALGQIRASCGTAIRQNGSIDNDESNAVRKLYYHSSITLC